MTKLKLKLIWHVLRNKDFNEVHTRAILALKKWSSLTASQKDTILKNLIKGALWKDGWLKLGVL